MFAPECLTKDWIVKEARRQGTQAVVLEKSIHALLLVGRLRQVGLDFVFKGGTSLMLHFNTARRLSIDVDIASLEPLEKVQEALSEVCDGAPFLQWSHQQWRDSENPPTKYFQVNYTSALDDSTAAVQLDVLEVANAYSVVEEKIIRTDFLKVVTEVAVRIPTVDCLLGDKLAAFAPSTIGILYQPTHKITGEPTEPRPIRVMKQLFDVGELLIHAKEPGLVDETYRRHFAHQNGYRGGGFTLEQALNDSVDAAYQLSQIDLKPVIENEKTTFFRQGHGRINTHLIGARYTLQDAKNSAARAALLATAIRTGQLEGVLGPIVLPSTDVLRGQRITGTWDKLDRLRNVSAEAFHRWYLVSMLEQG